MERKYQVFISSTYNDLRDERQTITNILLMADCIPAGMETFVATDDEQFSIIKRVIDLCDYYVLVIGTRYGTINETTGKSYTEMEYDYALSKGIPILVFAKTADLDTETTSEPVESRAKLKAFRERALTGRLSSMWSTLSDLSGKVAISIMKAKTELPQPGWLRNLGFDPEKVTQELNVLRDRVITLEKENTELKQRQKETHSEPNQVNLAQYKVSLHFKELQLAFSSASPDPEECDVELTLEEVFKYLSVRISGKLDDKTFREQLSTYKPGFLVNSQQALIIKNQLIALGLLETVEAGDKEYIKLSELGKQEMMRLNAPQAD